MTLEYYWPELKDKKAEWGEGPWVAEPDKVSWTDESTGYPCLIRRNSSQGILCGYVGVPPGHPAHGKGYYEVDVEVHGGLTFADSCQLYGDQDMEHAICHVAGPGEPDEVWWLGFDCGHYADLSPGFDLCAGVEPPWPTTYKHVRYVKAECERLAQQLASLQAGAEGAG